MSHLIAPAGSDMAAIREVYGFLGDNVEYHDGVPDVFADYVIANQPEILFGSVLKPLWWGLAEDGEFSPLTDPPPGFVLLLANEGNDPARQPPPLTPEQITASALATAQIDAIERIDAITGERINSAGFEFPSGSGQIFSTSAIAQQTWAARAGRASRTPDAEVQAATQDSARVVRLDAAGILGAADACVARVDGLLAAGAAARLACLSAASAEEVEAIIAAYAAGEGK